MILRIGNWLIGPIVCAMVSDVEWRPVEPKKPPWLRPPPVRPSGKVDASAIPVWPPGQWDLKNRVIAEIAKYDREMREYCRLINSGGPWIMFKIRLPNDLRQAAVCDCWLHDHDEAARACS